jgi:FAD:protein FMN transferase
VTTEISRWRQIGTNVDVVVSNASLDAAVKSVKATIDLADRTFSRFRSDSELSLVNRSHGRLIRVSELLGRAVGAALDAAALTDGLVDPSVGSAVRLTGYDRDFSLVRDESEGNPAPWQFVAVPGWRAVEFDSDARTIRIPRGVELDLDSTGKALIVDMAVRAAAATLSPNEGLLVSIGGDIRVAGRPPRGGWRVQLAEDSAAPISDDLPVAVIRGGALATSSTTVRRWRRGGETLHHLIDPRTGRPCDGPWRTATVVAGDCVGANTAATCAIVLGDGATRWLEARGLAARLVANDGSKSYLGGWPVDLPARTSSAAA